MWAGNLLRIKEGRLHKKAKEVRQASGRKGGRPRLRWEDCINRDVRKAEEYHKWSAKVAEKETWKGITAGVHVHELTRTRTNTYTN